MTNDYTVRYTIRPKNPHAHLFEVSCTVTEPDPGGQHFSLPAWIPGSYMIREFARNIVTLSARCGEAAVAVDKQDKDTYRCAPCQGPLTVSYEVYAWDLSVRAAHLDQTHGYFNGTSVFLRPHGLDARPCLLDIQPPEGAQDRDWRIGTALAREGAALYGFGSYRAADYDELVDHPVEMGSFTLASFEAGGVPHDVIVTGRHRADMERLCADLRRICEQQIALFGELPPMERYVFLVMAVGEGYGGLEHRSSTSLLCSRKDLPQAGQKEVGERYRTFLGLCSHEYFHTWNVKRIKPAAFLPYDLTREAYTRQLWAFEGITSYYDDLALVRSGLIGANDYLQLLGETATRVWRTPGRFKQSVAESSFDAWTKFYRQDENAPNAIVSYYAKGALVALALDLTLREVTGGKRSLDDVMRLLWERYGKRGEGVPEDGVERIAAEVAGTDLRAFFDASVRGTEDLPLERLLAAVGVRFVLRPAESAEDRGGRPATKNNGGRGVLGVRLVDAGDGSAKLANVFADGAAQRAGLSAGDVLAAVDGLRIRNADAEKNLGGYPAGTRVRVHAFRRDELMEFDVELMAPPADTVYLELQGEVEASVAQRRTAWLGG